MSSTSENAPASTLAQQLEALASSHALTLDPASIRTEEAGLDFRVAFATDREGTEWVLRIPRREDVSTKLPEESRILAFVSPRLSIAVPGWRICAPTLVAYPRLPGSPGLTLDPETKAPRFHVDPTSPVFAAALGRFIAELHRIDPDEARAAGVPVKSPEEVRETWREQLATVSSAFTLSPALASRWSAWMDDDGLWPQRTVLTHGELYAAHVLVDEELQVRSVLDWTTAKVADPAIDFAYQHLMAGPSFDVTVRAYQEAGGDVHLRLAERCAEIMAAGPINYAMYALTTGRAEDRDAAASLLNPAA